MNRISFFVLALFAGIAHAAPAPPRVFVDTRWNYLIGGFAGGHWKEAAGADRWAHAGQSYAVFDGPNFKGKFAGGAAKIWGGDCPSIVTVKIALPPPRGPIPGLVPRGVASEGIGVSGLSAAQIAPMQRRLPREVPVAPLQSVVAQWLRAHGVKNPQVTIVKAWSADLDGDGKREVLISAMRHFGKGGVPSVMRLGVRAGDYSLLLVRRGTQIVAVDSQIYPRDKADVVPTVRELAALLDLNGDGKMEIVVRGQYYEGSWAEVFEWRGGKPKAILHSGCGI